MNYIVDKAAKPNRYKALRQLEVIIHVYVTDLSATPVIYSLQWHLSSGLFVSEVLTASHPGSKPL